MTAVLDRAGSPMAFCTNGLASITSSTVLFFNALTVFAKELWVDEASSSEERSPSKTSSTAEAHASSPRTT